MADFDQTLPSLVAQFHTLEFDYGEGDGIDYEPFEEFFPASENKDWIQAWTGNKEIDGAEYRVFGQDGTGGYAAFWLVREGKPILEQPVVFFGSEGEMGIVASDFNDYLWLFAGGVGPMEAVEYGADEDKQVEPYAAFAKKHAAGAEKSAAAVLEAAKAAFPTFEEDFRKLIAY